MSPMHASLLYLRSMRNSILSYRFGNTSLRISIGTLPYEIMLFKMLKVLLMKASECGS